MNLLKIKDYGIPVVRILNPLQIMLYKTNGLEEIATYVTMDSEGNYKLVFVFDREKSHELYKKFRNHELEIGKNLG